MSPILLSILILTPHLFHIMILATVITTQVAVIVTILAVAILIPAEEDVIPAAAAAATKFVSAKAPSDCYDLLIAITFFIRSSSRFVHPARNTCWLGFFKTLLILKIDRWWHIASAKAN